MFSRDCLEVDIELNRSGSRTLTLSLNHLKSKYAETADERLRADRLRRRQASAVADILRERFPGRAYDKSLFAVLGDLNDEPSSPCLRPLLDKCDLVNALDRIPREQDRWTHWYRSDNTVGALDYVLLSPALDRATRSVVPTIERRRISFARVLADGGSGPRQTRYVRREDDSEAIDVDFRFTRFPEVRPEVYASDHCPVAFEVG
jgi:endonuclease/exonuclease/phosphatase family metal-dependent hydrolase